MSCRADAPVRHRPPRRSCRSSRARSSRCTRAASRRTTPPTSATPPSTSPTTCCSGACATSATRPAACATSPTSTTTCCARPASSACTTSTWPRPRSARFDDDMAGARHAPVLERAPGHLGHRRHPRLHRHGARPGPRLPGRRRRLLRRVDRSRASARSATTTATRCSRSPPSGAATSTTPTSATRSTSCSGSRRPPTSRRGSRCGARAGPGWHIECSALALRELGTTIDLHGGGADLIFPHHECEAAQSEAATGEPFVRHWMHQAMVRMDGEKMSKSLGNLVFVSDLLQGVGPAGDPPGRSSSTTTARRGSGTTTLHARRPPRGSTRWRGGRRGRRRPRRGPRRASTTTSTRRPRWPPSTPPPRAGEGVSRRGRAARRRPRRLTGRPARPRRSTAAGARRPARGA